MNANEYITTFSLSNYLHLAVTVDFIIFLSTKMTTYRPEMISQLPPHKQQSILALRQQISGSGMQ